MVTESKYNKNLFPLYLLIASSFIFIFRPWLIILPLYSSFDEIIVLLALFYYLVKKNNCHRLDKEFYVALIIMTFFLCYSLYRGVNVAKAAIFDFIVFLKPLITFFVIKSIPVSIESSLKNKFKNIFLVCGIYCWGILPFIHKLYPNTAAYYPACLLSGVGYLFFSDRKKINWLIALLFFVPGLFSLRAKFFTEFLLFTFVGLFLKEKVKLNLKWILLITVLTIGAIYVSYEKFAWYFLSGTDTEAVRTLFYINSGKILFDYFPLGPGFGTFATEAAAKYYSPLYYDYGMAYVWGATKDDYGTSSNFLDDTFYPAITQFGIVGCFLFIWFWIRRYKEAVSLSLENYRIYMFIFATICIQNIAANSFTGPTSIPYMLYLALINKSNPINRLLHLIFSVLRRKQVLLHNHGIEI